MILDTDKKDILIAALRERYQAMHIIRSRVQSIGLWSLGIFLGASGWLIQANLALTLKQRVVFSLAVLIAFIVLRYVYLRDLHKGFQGQQRSAVNIEETLGYYTPGEFNDSNEPIYPKEWKHAGTGNGSGNYFFSTYILIYTGVCLLLFTILFKGCLF